MKPSSKAVDVARFTVQLRISAMRAEDRARVPTQDMALTEAKVHQAIEQLIDAAYTCGRNEAA